MIKFASRPPTANIVVCDLMTDRRNLAQLTRFFQRVKEDAHGFIWSARVEKWLVPQLITDGEIGPIYRGLIDSRELQARTPLPEVIVSTCFADLADFQNCLINKELHCCSTMFVLINQITDMLTRSPNNPS
eukprot:jgi/Tetstr1/433766/TSEL_022983.t1